MSLENQKKNRNGLKVVSVMLAILLWFYIVNQDESSAGSNTVQAELKYYNVPANLVVSGPESVSVKLWGSLQNTANIVAYVDLEGMDAGVHKLPVNIEAVKGAMFTSVQPKQVELRLEDIREETVPIHYEIKNPPRPGYQLKEIITVPDRCIVKGQSKLLDKVAKVVCSVDLGNSEDISSSKIALQARDAKDNVISEGIKLLPANVEVFAVVEASKDQKKIPIKAQFEGELAPGYQLGEIIVEPAEVSVLGDSINMDSLLEVLTEKINVEGSEGELIKLVKLQEIDGIMVYPSQVTVKINIKKMESEEAIE